MLLYVALAEAVRRESAEAVQYFWGVGQDTVWRWRKALGVGALTEGTRALKSEVLTPVLNRAVEAARPTWSDPARAAKISAAKKGVSRPPESARKTGAGHLGMHHTAEARQKMRAAAKGRKCTGPGRTWTAEEDELVRTLTPAEAAARTGRSLVAVWERRKKLRVNCAG